MKVGTFGPKGRPYGKLFLLTALMLVCGAAWAQNRVQYGRITAVNVTTQASTGAQAGGALIGGTVGLAAGSGRSGSNRILGGIGGAVAGQQIGRLATRTPVYEYTILVGGTTTTMTTDQAGFRIGDCVAVERGQFNNLRLVDDSRCAPRAAAPTQTDVREADACIAAKNALLDANTDEDFDRAERRVRLLCE